MATLCKTDKWNAHWYADRYQTHFAPLRHRRLNLLEIGVGGYLNPLAGGDSLRMWKAYFRRATIYGLDIVDKRALQEDRIVIVHGDQADEHVLRQASEQAGGFDIVVDDGSHRSEDVLASFRVLFPLLRDGGFYAVEDLQTSYWSDYGGGTGPGTSMAYFKSLADGLNYSEFENGPYEPTYFDRHVVAVHFYHNLVIIEKGENNR